MREGVLFSISLITAFHALDTVEASTDAGICWVSGDAVVCEGEMGATSAGVTITVSGAGIEGGVVVFVVGGVDGEIGGVIREVFTGVVGTIGAEWSPDPLHSTTSSSSGR